MTTKEIPVLIPDEFGGSEQTPPLLILRVQQDALPKRTGGLIEAIIRSATTKNGEFIYSFYLSVPSLDKYTYELLSVKHPVQFYPLEVTVPGSRGTYKCSDEGQFVGALKEIFSSENFMKTVAALIGQAKQLSREQL
jgi:hypothetical protein